jgi:hypothetical protein
VLDALAYWLTLARLRVVYGYLVCGPRLMEIRKVAGPATLTVDEARRRET